jgi:hypothetical protein
MVQRSLIAPTTSLYLFALLASALALPAEDGWVIQGSVGAVVNLETSLKIRQEGFETIELDADYETHPFESPLYYSLRAGRWKDRRGWELELIHQKLFLQDPPPEVQGFAISHGYNVLTLNRAWEAHGVVWRVGAGAVIAHPESQVRGRVLDPDDTNLEGGYHLTGPSFQAGAEKRFALGKRWFLGLEGKATVARAVVPVAGGEAEVPNAAFHGLFGIGYR